MSIVKHFLIWLDKWFAGWETEFSCHQLESMFRRVGFTIDKTYGAWMVPSFGYRVMREVFKNGRPAIIGTHRVNFMGSLDENNRKNNLRQLKMLLNAIMEKWPEAEFMTTDQLGDIITCQ